MKRLLLLFFALLQMNGLWAQIQLLNPSFEQGLGGGACGTGTAPTDWTLCEIGAGHCALDSFATELTPDSAFDGRYVAFITVEGNSYNGALGQLLNCDLIPGYEYRFSVALALIWANTVPSFYIPGSISIYAGSNSCSYDELIFLSPILDTFWQVYNVRYTPSSNQRALIFRGVPNYSGNNYNVDIDALSPISILNAHQIHSYAADTLLPIGSTACLHLNAYTDTTYNRVWWEQIGIGLLDNQIDAGMVCTDTTTTYVIHMLGNDSTCAGYLPSSDTVRVRFYDPNSISSPSLVGWGVKLYPNPATDMLTIETEQTGVLSIYNSIGQLVLQSNIQNRTSNISIAEFASGVYQYRFRFADKSEQYGKLVKQ